MSSTQGRTIRLGVIGTGLAVEQLHWPALKRMTDKFAFTGFANHTREKAEHFASYTGANMRDYHADYHDLLRRDDVEAVLISLPISLLYEAARASLEAGKHVICEKPPGGDEDEGRAFLALETAYPDRVILIAENVFYRDDVRQARALLDAGAIGRLHAMTWRRANQIVPKPGNFSETPWRHKPAFRGGAHLDGGVHQVAQMRMLCGDVERVAGEVQRSNATLDAPSDLALNLRFVGGAIGSYSAVYPDIPLPPEPDEMRLYGTDATMIVGGKQVRVFRPNGTIETHRFEGTDGGYYGEFLNFYEALAQNAPVVSTVHQSFLNMLVVLRGLDAAERGEVVSLTDAPGGLSAQPLSLWKPYGAAGLFDGLPGTLSVETRQGD